MSNIFEFRLPDLSEKTSEVILVALSKKEGERIEKDETIVEVMTDKASLEIASPVAGIIKKNLRKEGDIIFCGEILALIIQEEK
ncbi:Biotin/lipoyl attachment domain protein [Candidatus Omnitrophus magneticus]|uniref:Biotin/lipoyl attachment domain protein n=1 Tax=Candidatus Omnitrophus magneticus TaxID=1609969 RepID=A0A0F0CUJ4_9BACT|nr:Biotin/lipoyl attachment domain protein [Candidatus Omnitrophus magneticus]